MTEVLRVADLIDRSELRERIYSRFGRFTTKVIATVEEGRVMSDWAFLEPFLNAAPAVKAEPVQHGRWIPQESGDRYKCSRCGHEVEVALSELVDPRDYEYYLDDYCGGCGAKMDGGIKDAAD